LYEVDHLIFDPTIIIIANAILDDAFKSDIRSVHDFYKVRVPTTRRSLDIEWKENKLDVPVFRQPDKSLSSGTSPDQPMLYSTYLEYLKRLGVDCGFKENLSSYMIRRGAGEAVEGMC
jgi:Protein of unknown function (DUF3435)